MRIFSVKVDTKATEMKTDLERMSAICTLLTLGTQSGVEALSEEDGRFANMEAAQFAASIGVNFAAIGLRAEHMRRLADFAIDMFSLMMAQETLRAGEESGRIIPKRDDEKDTSSSIQG